MTYEAMTTPAHKTGRTAHTPGPWGLRHSRDGSGDVGITANGVANVIAECFAAMRSSGENATDEALANARLIAAAPATLDALRKIRLWLAVEGCWEQVEIADDALIAAGETDVACPHCSGAGEWDEGPLPATSSAQISPDYRQIKCPECNGSGLLSIAPEKTGAV